MKNKKGFWLSILFVFFICGVSIPLFMTNHRKVKADTITDLTGTTWLFNNNIDSALNIGVLYVNFVSNDVNFNRIDTHEIELDGYLIYGATNFVSTVYDGNNSGWVVETYKTIVISGGTDVTNSTLITWLQNNATLQTLSPSTGTQITHKYWSLYHFAVMENNQVVSDENIEYTILYNQYRTSSYQDTTQTGLIFKGMTTNDPHSYIESINGSGINLLYMGDTNTIYNACLYEFTTGDYMDSDLYDFLTECGVWFDDDELDIYIVGVDEGIIRGEITGRALGQADGTQYTGLITGIFNGLGNLLSIQVFPNITIGLLIGLPLLLGVFIIILKILRG